MTPVLFKVQIEALQPLEAKAFLIERLLEEYEFGEDLYEYSFHCDNYSPEEGQTYPLMMCIDVPVSHTFSFYHHVNDLVGDWRRREEETYWDAVDTIVVMNSFVLGNPKCIAEDPNIRIDFLIEQDRIRNHKMSEIVQAIASLNEAVTVLHQDGRTIWNALKKAQTSLAYLSANQELAGVSKLHENMEEIKTQLELLGADVDNIDTDEPVKN